MASEKRTEEQIDSLIKDRLNRANKICLIVYRDLHTNGSHSTSDVSNLAYANILSKIYDEIKAEEEAESPRYQTRLT